jgi:translation initiation factor 2 subunit 2
MEIILDNNNKKKIEENNNMIKTAKKLLDDKKKKVHKIKIKPIIIISENSNLGKKLLEKYDMIIKDLTEEKKKIVKIDYNSEIFEENNTQPEKIEICKQYLEYLNRIYSSSDKNNIIIYKEIKLKSPQVYKEGPKKTAISNFTEIYKSYNRTKEHLSEYIFKELSKGSINEKGCLILAGKYFSKDIESVLKKYIEYYVKCDMCNSVNTEIIKEGGARISFIICNNCKAERSV